MSSFAQLLVSHLSEQLEVTEEAVVNALNSFCVGDKEQKVEPQQSKQKAITKKTPPSTKGATNVKKATEITHTCERIKKGQKTECGKPAKRSLFQNGKEVWFCGTDNTGCYKIESNKTETSKQKEDKTGVVDRKEKSEQKTQALIKSVVDKQINREENTKTIIAIPKKVNGKIVYMDKTRRILIHKETQSGYGILDVDNKTILELDQESKRWLESINYNIEGEKKNTKGYQSREKAEEESLRKKSNKKIQESSSSTAEEISDIEEDNVNENDEDEEDEEENEEQENGDESEPLELNK